METTIPEKSSTAKDFFLHLLSIITLYGSVISLIALLFQYIQYTFPDVLEYSSTGILDTIKWSVAFLVIMYPVFIFTSGLIDHDLSIHQEKAEYRVRKWLLYFTLFIASITIIGDLVALVYRFLNGDITLRFSLKVLVVLAVAGSMFSYYFWDVRRTDFSKKTVSFSCAILSALFIAISVVAGFFIVGSPSYQRQIRLDDRRVSDLLSIQSQVLNTWMTTQKLPTTLKELQDPLSGFVLPVDPDTGKEYEYSVTSNLSFKLCATFGSSNATQTPKQTVPASKDLFSQNWSHGVGTVCFDRTIDPEIYKPSAKNPPIVPMNR